jgi:hypothetical protein|tara:strand:- start:51 stop:440 length:390 start_codon:yes stop_codon:yes gene_type:complete
MPTYEINLWQDKKIIEKVVKQFDKDEDVLKFIHEHFDDDEELPRLDQEKGYLRPKKTSIIITWSKIATYVRKNAPKRLELDENEKELKGTLEKSITTEVINEWGYNEMLRHTRKAYGPNPKAKGYYDHK